MTRSLTFGHLRGIPVGASPSALALVGLIAFLVAEGLLPASEPGLDLRVRWGVGLATAVLFAGSILAHELGHALVAQRAGVRVERIDLWLFGGVARLSGEARTPGQAFRIAGAGPLVSVVVGAAAVAMSFGSSGLGNDASAAALAWLGVANLVLAVFNLLPGLPLDGGRMLHAVLWRRYGDRDRATRTAARAGRGVGLFLLGLAALQVLYGNLFGGIWMALIASTVRSAATAEGEAARVRHLFGGLRIREVMRPAPVTVPVWADLDELIATAATAPPQAAYPLVGWSGGLAGVVTLDGLSRVPADPHHQVRLGDLASPPDQVPQAHPDELLVAVLERAAGPVPTGAGTSTIVVVDEAAVVGLITDAELRRAADLAQLNRSLVGSGR